MTEILVAVDGHEHCERIVDAAIRLAKPLSAKIILTYVAPKLPVPDEYAASLQQEEPEIEDYYEEFSRRMLGDLDARAKKQGVQVETLFGVGNPTEFILQKAKARKVSFIVLGACATHRLKGIRSIGSVTTRVIQNSPVPVVAVP